MGIDVVTLALVKNYINTILENPGGAGSTLSEKDAIETAVETGLISPAVSEDGEIYIEKDGIIFVL